MYGNVKAESGAVLQFGLNHAHLSVTPATAMVPSLAALLPVNTALLVCIHVDLLLVCQERVPFRPEKTCCSASSFFQSEQWFGLK